MVTVNSLLKLDKKQVLLNLGCNIDYEPSTRVISLVNEYVEIAQNLIEPSYSYIIRNVEYVASPIVFVEDSIIFKSRVIAGLLEQCEMVAIFALTIGKRLERMINQLARDRLVLEATVLDAVGSVAAEGVADILQAQIGMVANNYGLTISRRFSPGYCDWNIGQQRMLFRALGDNTNGIRLTDTCLMLPQKSISGIIGIGLNEIENYNPCETCDKKNCTGRR